MTQEQMREASNKKFKQVIELMDLLKVRFEPKQKVSEGGFIEHVVVFVDDERYPSEHIVRNPEVAPLEKEVTDQIHDKKDPEVPPATE